MTELMREARLKVQTSGSKLRRAKQSVKKAKTQFEADIVEARSQGVSITDISKLSGMPRTNIYAILDENARQEL